MRRNQKASEAASCEKAAKEVAKQKAQLDAAKLAVDAAETKCKLAEEEKNES